MEKMKFIGGVDFDELKAQRIKVYDTFTFDLSAARTDKEFLVTGNYIYVLEATDINTLFQVRLNEKPRSLIPLYKGRGVRAPFYRLYLTNAAQAGKTVTLAIGIESDTFEVFDVGKALEISGEITISTYKKTLDGEAFIGYIVKSPVAAEYTHAQIFNPADSGIKVVVNRIVTISEAATKIFLSYYDTALTQVGTGVKNKYSGATDPVGEIRADTDNARLGTMISLRGEPSITVDWEFDPAIVLGEGKGLCVIDEAANQSMNASFEWLEV